MSHTMGKHQGHLGKHQAWLGGRGTGGKHGHESLLWFPWEKTGESWQAGLGLASLYNFIVFWSIGAVPSCLLPGHGEKRMGFTGNSKGGWRAWVLDWLVCLWKLCLLEGEWFSISRN